MTRWNRLSFHVRLFSLVLVVGAAGCQQPPSKMGALRIATSTIMAPAVDGWLAELSKPPSPINVSLAVTGSTTALQQLVQGEVDLAVTSRRMSANEFLAAQAQGRKIEESLVGFGIYRVLVNSKNTVSSLTLDQVGDLFSRQIKDWSECGGPKGPVSCVYRRTLPGHFDLFFEKEVSVKFGADWAHPDPGIVVANDTAAIVAAIQANPGAVGYLLATDPAQDLKALAIQSPLSKTPQAPSVEAALAGVYPLLRPLYLYIDAHSPRGVQYFREFAVGDKGRKLIETAGFAPAPPLPGSGLTLDPMNRVPAW